MKIEYFLYVCLTLIVLHFFYWRQQKKKGWLSSKTRRYDLETFIKSVKITLTKLLYPNPYTPVLLGIFMGIILYLSTIISYDNFDPFLISKVINQNELEESLSLLSHIQVGILAASIPIIIFVIKLSGDNKGSLPFSEVLITDSFLYLILSFEFLVLGWMVWVLNWNEINVDYLHVFVSFVIISLILTISLFYKALRFISDQEYLRSKSRELLNRKLIQDIEEEIEVRRRFNILYNELTDSGVEFSFFPR